ncbi:hypothetical protein NSK_002395 [Nannochloropsis salina CCMP1776]|uniref:Hflx-type G domain-containing protein n=1 Tax=Nannochloropsis salina CCMP1776 TaxID=1027361 RepID=A0A4D9D733_9STRA|nr:hypothetical protein NSK_002395 [Nannochloropsis salina CCMP1776]|eukprot:TFJ86187.1 hypothetical protein NSK_002395 [Nannochloropsis salina CCMP1776]
MIKLPASLLPSTFMFAAASMASAQLWSWQRATKPVFGDNFHRNYSIPPKKVPSAPVPNCIVLHITPPRSTLEDRLQEEDFLDEACALAQTLGYAVPVREILRLRAIHPKTFIGKGKVVELRGLLRATDAILFINTPRLTALQQRNLKELCQTTDVKDRISVILDIFGQRARTMEAKLQVELAQCKYALSHLVRGASAGYEQQRGASGTGFMAGRGEKALELRRRQLRGQSKVLQHKLKTVEKRRMEQRKHRRQPIVSLLGYTNVGKSSLLNALTHSHAVSVEDRPFETLDTTTRALYLPSVDASALLTDTVGFIRQLPLELVASFRATLEEAVSADLLLHVRDASTLGTPLFAEQYASVDKILRDVGTPEHLKHSMVEVWNKVDLLTNKQRDEMARVLAGAKREASSPDVVLVSAQTKEGMRELVRMIGDRLVEGGFLQPAETRGADKKSSCEKDGKKHMCYSDEEGKQEALSSRTENMSNKKAVNEVNV